MIAAEKVHQGRHVTKADAASSAPTAQVVIEQRVAHQYLPHTANEPGKERVSYLMLFICGLILDCDSALQALKLFCLHTGSVVNTRS